MKTNIQALRAYLDSFIITSQNIGDVRRRLMMPFDCEWNGTVRDETATREVRPPEPEPTKPFMGFTQELRSLLNRSGRDQAAETPDDILASFLRQCLFAWTDARQTMKARARGNGDEQPDSAQPDRPPVSIPDIQLAIEKKLLAQIDAARDGLRQIAIDQYREFKAATEAGRWPAGATALGQPDGLNPNACGPTKDEPLDMRAEIKGLMEEIASRLAPLAQLAANQSDVPRSTFEAINGASHALVSGLAAMARGE